METTILLEMQNLNTLVKDCLRAQRLYGNAGKSMRLSVYSRFLKHESANRSRYATRISNILAQENIDLDNFYVSHNGMRSNARLMQQAVTGSSAIHNVDDCIDMDTEILKCIDTSLHSGVLSPGIKEMLNCTKNEIFQSNIELKKMMFEEDITIHINAAIATDRLTSA